MGGEGQGLAGNKKGCVQRIGVVLRILEEVSVFFILYSLVYISLGFIKYYKLFLSQKEKHL